VLQERLPQIEGTLEAELRGINERIGIQNERLKLLAQARQAEIK
jgi:hypothetical protein